MKAQLASFGFVGRRSREVQLSGEAAPYSWDQIAATTYDRRRSV